MSNLHINVQIVPELVQLIVIDSFCGAGGFTEGVEQAIDKHGNRLAVVIVGINHDKGAIASHAKNHPEGLLLQGFVVLPVKVTIVQNGTEEDAFNMKPVEADL